MEDYIDEIEELDIDDRFLPELSTKFIAVTLPNGRLIVERKPYLTLIAVIEAFGIENIKALGLMGKYQMPLVSDVRLNPRDYQPTSNGLFVYTNMNLKEKVAIIEKIGELVGSKLVCATKRFYGNV